MKLQNSKGEIFYGLHFYPGVAEYKEYGEDFRVFLNEDTIRAMGPTFAGRPVFVFHKDEVNQNLDKLRSEADGWVVESFFNEADGKHWVKFIVCSEKGKRAVEAGYRLSNCYTPKDFSKGGEWNGVSYAKEVTGGEYDHLAILPNPRYEESVVLTPEKFKAYNESKRVELFKLANGGQDMGLKLFKRQKLENSADIENTVVVLPKSNREVDITTLVNEADASEMAKRDTAPKFANMADLVKVGEGDDAKDMPLSEVVKLANKALEMGDDGMHEAETPEDLANADDDDEDLENSDDEDLENGNPAKADESPEDKPVDDAKKKNKKKNGRDEPRELVKNGKDGQGRERAAQLRNAHERGPRENFAPAQTTYDPTARMERGKARYG